MLRAGSLRDIGRINRFANVRRVKFIGIGITVLGISYALLPSTKKRVVKSSIGSTVRFARSVKIGATISMDYLIAPLMGHIDTEIHRRSANRIVEGCLKNGGIYIKLGQGLGAVNHVLPREYVEILSTLQDKCLTREKDEFEEIFLQDFGKKPEEMLREIEPEPIAAASLAQVYKGVTLDGEKVAIKVQYIDLQDRFMTDIKAIIYLLRVITVIHPKFDLHWVLNEVFEALVKELDFENEGKNGEQCAEDLKKFSYAYVPKIHWDLSSKRVLTAEWIDGVKVTDVEKIKAQGLDLADIDKKLITLMAEQIFHTGFVHADPHPGNVFVRKGKDNKAQIVLLDHGLYEHLSEKTRRTLCDFWESMVLNNDRALKTYANDWNVEDYVLLAEMLMQAPYRISFKTRSNSMVMNDHMIRITRQRFDKITEILRVIPRNMLLVIRNLNTIRAIIRDHGDIINRYRIMARIATRGRYTGIKRSCYGNIAGICNAVRFEFRLWLHNVTLWILNVYLNILKLVGYDVTKMLQMLNANSIL